MSRKSCYKLLNGVVFNIPIGMRSSVQTDGVFGGAVYIECFYKQGQKKSVQQFLEALDVTAPHPKKTPSFCTLDLMPIGILNTTPFSSL